MSCQHEDIYNYVRPDMGSFPSSWTCGDCGRTVVIQWLPNLKCACKDDFLCGDHYKEKMRHDPNGHICDEKKCPMWEKKYATYEELDALRDLVYAMKNKMNALHPEKSL